MPNKYYRTLTIAGADSSGGAGIQADLKTFSALECYGMSVITALTAQNTTGVYGIHSVPPKFIQSQLDAVYTDIGTDAVKIGMLHTSEIIEAIVEKLEAYKVENIVLDPVMVAKSGDKLLEDSAIQALKELLIPKAYCITPNLPEAEVLLDEKITSRGDNLVPFAQKLLELGPFAVLLKGGHLESKKAVDVLTDQSGTVKTLSAKRVHTKNTHGTGCTLSSAIAAYLAKGYAIADAVEQGKNYLTQALKTGKNYQLGKGHGPVHHFYQQWK